MAIFRDGGLDVLKKKQCSKHNSQIVSGFCFACSEFVCVCCLLENHDKHRKEVRSLEESVAEKRKEVARTGVKLGNRLEIVEAKQKRVEKETEELEQKLKILTKVVEMRRVEKKDLALEKDDLRMRKDTILRLSNTPTDVSLLEKDLFSSLLETANNVVNEAFLSTNPREKGVVCRDGLCLSSSFPCGKRPLGVCVDGKGNFLIAEFHFLRVRDREWNVVDSLEKEINSLKLDPVDVALGLNDQIVILDWNRHQVVILNKEGEFVRSFGSKGSKDGQFKKPYGVVVDDIGHIIVTDTHNHRIQVFSEDGFFIQSFSFDGQLKKPWCTAVDRNGHLVVSDSENHIIRVVDIEGRFVRQIRRTDSSFFPKGVDVDGEGRIFVCESEKNRVSVFEQDGKFLYSFGGIYLRGPLRVVVDSFGSVLVVESDGNSLQLWKSKKS